MGGIVGQKPTRPPGSPKTSGSGRKKGTLNKATAAFNEAVNLLKLDREGKPMAAIMIGSTAWLRRNRPRGPTPTNQRSANC